MRVKRSDLFTTKFLVWWSIVWALIIGILAPIVNSVTPLLDSDYNNMWTPDLFWRLVLYWHGAFIPWVASITFVFGMLYAMVTLNMVFLYVAAFGGLLMGLGALIGAEHVRKAGKVTVH